MGFLKKSGRLFNQLVNWLGKVFKKFIHNLINNLNKVWKQVETALIKAYGFVHGLYVIFYKGYETIMEVWDSKFRGKPSQVFTIKEAPQDSPLPTRENSKPMVLETTK
ncbi:hypothetical protein [Lyngbya sp. PCC 8106]|uniref:hypothetical protein n=1 Tax=Lyngbya sp. (strain PCC 8106) TaxID=313612 RepID=UPI0000EA9D51|nr:hypothetical protein [Lyngbya sp. PCC 8106]EAW39011.1 hypothetical protein L8106_01812 [Lyngbya sp. PCC 8106]